MTWKERYVQFLWKAHCFPVLQRIWGQCDDFENFDPHKCDLAKTCCAWPETSVLYNFYGKRTVFPFWREFKASVTILTTLTLKNAIWPKGALHDLKDRFCTIFMTNALFSPFGENLRPVWRFWELWRHKCELAKTCCSWPKKRVLYNFYGKRTVFPFRREFETSVTIFRSLTLKNAIWPNRAAHDLKRRFCTIFIISALFCLLGKIFRPVWRFWELWPSQMRFCQNVLRMTWNERFVQFSWKPHCFPLLARISGQCDDFDNFDAQKCDLTKTCSAWPEKRVFLQFLWKAHCFLVLKRIWGQCDDFENFDPHKCDLAKTCCAWPETSVLYNFHGKRTVFSFWREFEASVTTFTTLTLTNAIWPKRAPHDLKRGFCTIFMESALFSRFEENLRPVWRFWELWPSQMRFGKNVLRMTWNERFVQFSWKAHCFLFLERIWGQCDDFHNFNAHKCDLAKTCSAWPEKRVLYNFYGERTVFPFWREFEASVTILTTLTLKNAIWLKRAPHDLKRALCTIFMESALFSLFGENLRPVWRLLQL